MEKLPDAALVNATNAALQTWVCFMKHLERTVWFESTFSWSCNCFLSVSQSPPSCSPQWAEADGAGVVVSWSQRAALGWERCVFFNLTPQRMLHSANEFCSWLSFCSVGFLVWLASICVLWKKNPSPKAMHFLQIFDHVHLCPALSDCPPGCVLMKCCSLPPTSPPLYYVPSPPRSSLSSFLAVCLSVPTVSFPSSGLTPALACAPSKEVAECLALILATMMPFCSPCSSEAPSPGTLLRSLPAKAEGPQTPRSPRDPSGPSSEGTATENDSDSETFWPLPFLENFIHLTPLEFSQHLNSPTSQKLYEYPPFPLVEKIMKAGLWFI